MKPERPAMKALADILLRREVGEQLNAEQVAAAGETICRKFADRLEPMVGTTGFRVLLRRALHLTRADFPLLEKVRSDETSDILLDGLRDTARGRDPDEVRDAVKAVIVRFLELVAYFMGDELTARIVTSAWPDLPPETTGPAFHEEAE